MKKVSIVIGLYNSERTIEAVLQEIDSVFALSTEYSYEIILVDDHSPDGVYALVKGLAEKDRRIKLVHLAKNAGQTNAVIEGYKYAKGEFIVEMDDDLQMPAAEIIHMLHELEAGDYDVVFAKYPEQKESAFRLFGSRVNNKMTEIMLGKPKNIRVNSFWVMRRYRERLAEIPGLVLNREQKGVKPNHAYFPVRVTDFGLSRDALYEALKGYGIFRVSISIRLQIASAVTRTVLIRI